MPPVYAPKYPLFADEGWWVLVGDVNRKTIFSFERITDNGRVVSKEVRLMVVSCVTFVFVSDLSRCRAHVRAGGRVWGRMWRVSDARR